MTMDNQKLSADNPPANEGEPLVSLEGAGIWYRLRSRRSAHLKTAFLQGGTRVGQDKFWALRDIDLECREGQILGVVGRNGAGKSTLCMLLAQILTPDEGRARIRGRVTPLLGLGNGFSQEMSGRDNVYLYGAFLGLNRAQVEAQLPEIIEFSELGKFIDEPIYTYSTGMRARLGFSVAATIEPEIMILDEVLGVGDRRFRVKSKKRIMELLETSKLIVIVSHSEKFLRDTCTHALWLEEGRVRAYGHAGEVLDAYSSESDLAGGDQSPRPVRG